MCKRKTLLGADKFVDSTKICLQRPAMFCRINVTKNLNVPTSWRWWDWIQAIIWNLFFLPKDANFVAAKWFRSPLWWCFPLARPAMEDINEPFKPEVPPPWWPWLPLPPPTDWVPPSPLVISVEEDGNPEAPEADIVEVDPPESIDNAEDDKVELPAKPPDPPGHGVGGPAITPPSAEIRSSEPAILWRRKQWELKIIISFFGSYTLDSGIDVY